MASKSKKGSDKSESKRNKYWSVTEKSIAVDAIKDFQDAAERKYKADMKLSSLLGLPSYEKDSYDKEFEKKKKSMKDTSDAAYYAEYRQYPEKKASGGIVRGKKSKNTSFKW